MELTKQDKKHMEERVKKIIRVVRNVIIVEKKKFFEDEIQQKCI